MAAFRPVDPKQSFPELEERILERWRERDVFHRSLEQRQRRPGVELLRGAADRQRRAGIAPRPVARLQGHLPPLPQHARPSRAAQGRLGLPRPARRAGGRAGARDLLEGRDRGLRDRRVQRALPRVGVPLRRGMEPAHRADRLLDRPRRPLRDAHELLHRVGLVVAAQDLGRRAPLRGPQGGPLLPPLRHGALLARGRPGLRGRRGPLRIRATARPRAEGATAGGGRAPGLDHHALDADLQRGGRRRPRDRVRAGAARRFRRGPGGRRAAGGARAGGGRRGPRAAAGQRPGRRQLRAAVPLHRRLRAARPHRARGRLRDHGGGHRPRAHRDRLRRGRLPARRAVRDQAPEPGASRTAPSTSGSPTSRASS